MAKRGKAVSTVVTEDKDWKKPAHSSFEGPAYGEVVPVGTVFKDAFGNTRVVTRNGTKVVKKA